MIGLSKAPETLYFIAHQLLSCGEDPVISPIIAEGGFRMEENSIILPLIISAWAYYFFFFFFVDRTNRAFRQVRRYFRVLPAARPLKNV